MPASRKDLISSYFPSESAGRWNNGRHYLFLSAGQTNSHQSEESIHPGTTYQHLTKAANLPLDPCSPFHIAASFSLLHFPTLVLSHLILCNCLLCLFLSSSKRHSLLGRVLSPVESQAGGMLQSAWAQKQNLSIPTDKVHWWLGLTWSVLFTDRS